MSLQLADGHNAKQNHFNVRLISVSYGASEPAGMAFTKSLASVSERSRDITLTALVPWFKIQTLTLTLTNTPNHTITLTQSQTLTQPRNVAFPPV